MTSLNRDIRFTTTTDGVDIAFWEIGEGKPLIILNNFGLSHAELEWTVPSIASFYTELADRCRVIRFDPRGVGLSGDPPGGWQATSPSGGHPAMTTEAMGLDITAVALAAGVDQFALMGVSVLGPVAIRYAAKHPEVSELILCDSFATAATSFMAPVLNTQSAILKVEADSGQSVISVWVTVVPQSEVQEVIHLTRASDDRFQGPDIVYPTATQLRWDAAPHLGDVAVPVLVLCSRTTMEDTLTDARRIAAGIPGAQLRVVDGTFAPYWSDRAATLEAIDALLETTGPARHAPGSGFLTVVITDIVGSTAFIKQVGDDAGRAVIRDQESAVATIASDLGGRVIKNLGDGSLIAFDSNSAAITFSVAVRREFNEGPIRLRVGMAAGEPIQEDGDIHGAVVAQAARIADLGAPGEILVSGAVKQLAAGKGFEFEDRGEVSLKGFDEPERVWAVR